MRPFRRQVLLGSLKLLDVTLMVIAFVLATIPILYVNGRFSFTTFLSMRISVRNFVLFSGLIILWHLVFSLLGLYHSKRLSGRGAEAVDVVKATSLGTLAIWIVGGICGIRLLDPLFLAVFWTISSVSILCARFFLRTTLAQLRIRHRNLRHMLIVGTNARALKFASTVEAKPELGYRIIGFADVTWPGMTAFLETGYQLLCDFDGFPELVRKAVVDEVLIALPMASFYSHASKIASICEMHGIVMRFLPSFFDLKLARSRAEEFEGEPIITLYTGTLEGWPAILKRVLDVTVSLSSIIILGPLALLVALLNKLTSPGPVFFIQKRVGINKRVFSVYKFRTMTPGAERSLADLEALNEATGPVFKIKNDPRITPFGSFLRKTSIDELPQLFNVLKGDMSLVGPRPLPVRDYEGFDQDWQRRRFSVRPGITCLWQISGRSNIPFQKWMELDMEYIDEWSLWLDLKILMRTIPAVLRGTGAA